MKMKFNFKSLFASDEIFHFFIKIGIFWLAASLLIIEVNHMIVRPANSTLEFNISSDINRLYLKGLINNPEVFWKTSELNERRGRLDDAVNDLQLGIALLELQNASSATLRKFNVRLNHLESLLQPQK
jgi:hypothetical protein